MRLSRWNTLASVFLAAILSAPAWSTTGANSALPGTLNYVEGQASIGDQTLDAKSIGSTQLQPGEDLATYTGKAEILLTPGVFLRIDNNSSVQMISPSLTKTEVAVNKGRAMVEVAEIHPQNDLRVSEDGVTTTLLKRGVYDFDATQGQMWVLDGEARVQQGDRQVTVKGGHEVALNSGAPLKATKFDKKDVEQSDLYRWSSLRSSYLAEANVDTARIYGANGWYGPGWVGAGWYWDPWFSAYTFIPGNGFFYSPFGFGFYSPLVVYRAPVFYGGAFYHHFGPAYRPAFAPRGFVRGGPVAHFSAPAPAFRGGGFAGGFRGGFGGRR